MQLSNTGVRFKLFCDYLNELQSIKELPPLTDGQLADSYASYVTAPDLEWIDIFENGSESRVIGFLLVAYPPNCHPDADFYIEEAYIAPEFRRSRYMTTAASKFISENDGVYCLFIIHGNDPAKAFWPKVFGSLGYEPMDLCDVGAGDEYCEQFGYKPKQDTERGSYGN